MRSILAKKIINWNVRYFTLFVGGILVFDGISKVISSFEGFQTLNFADPILGISIRHLLLIVAMAELTIAYFCLFTARRNLALMLVGWLAANFIIHVIGLWAAGCHLPSGWINYPIYFGSSSPLMTDYLVATTSAMMIVGSGLILWSEHKSAQTANFHKISCPSCGGHIKFPAQNIGQQIPCPHCQKGITLHKPDLIKMACFFCQEHIEFPAHAIGEKMPCPHCKMDITLKEPT